MDNPPAPEEPTEPHLPAPTGDSPIAFMPVGSGFSGSYAEPPVKLPASYDNPGLELPIDLACVAYLEFYNLSDPQRSMLSQYGFVVAPDDDREHFRIYQETADNPGEERPIFVTIDSMLHVYHLIFDKILRDLEDEQFAPLLERLTGELVRSAGAQYEETKGTSLEEPALHAWAYLAVAEQLIMADPPAVSPVISSLVSAELELINAHASISSSPVMTLDEAYIEDYTQYVPRGHYSRTELRKRYFKTMMWFGRMNMRLMEPLETQIALLVTRLIHQTMLDDIPAARAWASIYDPTAFLVGNSDDLGIREYSAVIPQVYGPEVSLAELADQDLLEQFIAAASALPPPQINSMLIPGEPVEPQTQGFRFMGQRFVLDGYVFQQLIHAKVANRGLPNSLDVMAAFGSEEAISILTDLGETAYPNYDSQMTKLQFAVSTLSEDDWSQNVYFNWLYALQAVIEPKGDSYPPFMRTQPWTRKDLHSALGSWAELKHDTILYAKQPYSVGAAPPLEAPPVQHWVEPCPLAYARLQALALLTREGLDTPATANENANNLLTRLIAKLAFLQAIAEKQLKGELITEDESDTLKYLGSWLEAMIDRSADQPAEPDPWGMPCDQANEPAAIVADVATDPFFTGNVLEVATGNVYEIFVVTPDGTGGLHLARGAAYSFYEFPWLMDDRLTDEAWREMLQLGANPPQPAWTASFITE